MTSEPCVTQTDHAQSPIVLYTELDAECDQQAIVIGELLTALSHICRQTDNCRLFVTFDDGGCAVEFKSMTNKPRKLKYSFPD